MWDRRLAANPSRRSVLIIPIRNAAQSGTLPDFSDRPARAIHTHCAAIILKDISRDQTRGDSGDSSPDAAGSAQVRYDRVIT